MDLPIRHGVRKTCVSGTALERPAREGDSPVHGSTCPPVEVLEYHPERLQGGKPGRPLSKAKYLLRPIVNKYREGKVKSTPGGE
jgi:hypothetical protein